MNRLRESCQRLKVAILIDIGLLSSMSNVVILLKTPDPFKLKSALIYVVLVSSEVCYSLHLLTDLGSFKLLFRRHYFTRRRCRRLKLTSLTRLRDSWELIVHNFTEEQWISDFWTTQATFDEKCKAIIPLLPLRVSRPRESKRARRRRRCEKGCFHCSLVKLGAFFIDYTNLHKGNENTPRDYVQWEQEYGPCLLFVERFTFIVCGSGCLLMPNISLQRLDLSFLN